MKAVTPSTEASARLTAELLAAQLADGGWAAHSGGPADTESTAFASLALATISKQDGVDSRSTLAAAEHGLSWLGQRQQADGGWPLSDQVPGSTWTTAPAVLALAMLDRNAEQVQRGASWLAARKATGYPLAARLVRWVTGAEDPRQVTELDPTIPGWPWAEDTFSWVEPTAHAMLALRAALARRKLTGAELANRRVSDGVRWFVDRMAPGGGWNYGNRRVLGQDIEPYPDTTAWALLALHGAAGPEITKGSLTRLHELMRTNTSALPRALTVLAFRAYQEDTNALTNLLASQCASQAPDTRPSDTRTRALALLALSGPPLPFHVT